LTSYRPAVADVNEGGVFAESTIRLEYSLIQVYNTGGDSAVPVHEEVLRIARRLCREAGSWTFDVRDVVHALTHLKESTVRTHVASRCCVNAPAHHPSRLPYFRREGRGVYSLEPAFRRKPGRERSPKTASRAAEPAPAYGAAADVALGDTIHAVVRRDRRVFTAECLEVAVVTQGRTLDEVVANLREAVDLHLEGEDVRAWGLTPSPRVTITYLLPRPVDAAAD
jgi:hypothetical protein